GDLERFLRRLDLAPLESEAGTRTENVRLLTFHAAKGLEFPVVFIAGAEEGIVPIVPTRAGAGDADPDEERRLFYVAMTRAMDELYVSYSLRRTVHGKDMDRMPSRYLSDIPDDTWEAVDDASAQGRTSPRGRHGAQLPLF
ncbi:MAG TPA: ATP-dependent helicase, partial [Coriobacteriia bacterium]|nr:ATP-dependent helicase [Coriobacteriia bacterium]